MKSLTEAQLREMLEKAYNLGISHAVQQTPVKPAEVKEFINKQIKEC
jgi:hypothetical protein